MKKTKYVSAFFFQVLFAGILAFSIQQSALAQAKEEIIPSTKHAGYSVKPGMGPEKGFQGYMLYRRTNLKDLLEEGKRMPGDTTCIPENLFRDPFLVSQNSRHALWTE